jgi:DNA-binding NtrC family response regulator/tetratricopeptide (TPR) repeat protein
MAPSYEAAVGLFRQGEFPRLIEAFGTTEDERRALSPRYRVIVANALAFLGHLDEAKRLAQLELNPPSGPPLVKSQAESTLALVHWKEGDVVSAFRHAQSALHLAQESKDPERMAWAHVHLFRLLAEGGSIENALAALPDVRRTIARAGISQATAYLHTCVAILEGQTGRLEEARRHCDISESLLNVSPNPWLSGQSLLLRGTVSLIRCDFDDAIERLRAAKEVATKSGHIQTVLAADTNIGHVQFLVGELDKAKETFAGLLADVKVPLFVKFAAAGGLAMVHLALGQLDDCERTLSVITGQVELSEQTSFLYHVRWATLTEAQVRIRRGQLNDAVKWLQTSNERYQKLGDIPLTASIHLVMALAEARTKHLREVSNNLIRSSELDVTRIRELQAQYYHGASMVLHDSDRPLADTLRRRALKVWKEQGIVSVRLQIDDNTNPSDDNLPSDAAHQKNTVECITDSLAAFTDLAHLPRLLGEEMLSAIEGLACCPDARIIERRPNAEPPEASSDTIVMPLGLDRKKHLTLVCKVPDDPIKAILLADVLRMGRAALALERARDEERSRAALWPAPPIEEQAGVLFLAEEMQTVLATVRRVAPTTAPVLITGETGTGKEVVARTIHAYSPRGSATFRPFNCSSVPKDMLDSQLFGHRRGSFTGATDHFPGVIRAAAGGTLFLDEIGEATPDVQPKLLRFLESNEVHPIGEVQPVRADVRVIAATNTDLDALIAQGRFREDLFYRLNIVRLHLPPLRERRVEIPPLAHHYLQKHAQEYAKGTLRLAEETMEYLVLYRWPGNIRQLANEMRRMAALAETDAVLMPEHLSPEIAASRRTVPASERVLDPTELVVRIDQPMSAAVHHLESTMIQRAMRLTGGRMDEAAAMLGLSRKGLYLKRSRYRLETPEREASADVA